MSFGLIASFCVGTKINFNWKKLRKKFQKSFKKNSKTF